MTKLAVHADAITQHGRPVLRLGTGFAPAPSLSTDVIQTPEVESEASAWGTACHQLSEKCFAPIGRRRFIGTVETTKQHKIEVDDESPRRRKSTSIMSAAASRLFRGNRRRAGRRPRAALFARKPERPLRRRRHRRHGHVFPEVEADRSRRPEGRARPGRSGRQQAAAHLRARLAAGEPRARRRARHDDDRAAARPAQGRPHPAARRSTSPISSSGPPNCSSAMNLSKQARTMSSTRCRSPRGGRSGSRPARASSARRKVRAPR
jgi:hypothetical protein